MNKNIEPVLALIKNSSKSSLRNVDYVQALIRAFGITYEDRGPYGYDNKFMNPHGTTGIYQTPRQMAEFLVEMSKYSLKSYLEIGVFQGGNYLFTTSYLKMFNPFMTGIALDITDQYQNEEMKEHVTITQGTSADFKSKSFDLVFIDADHEYASVMADFENVGQYARWCSFHDIDDPLCPGPNQLWNEIKHLYPSKKFVNINSDPAHGIGLMRIKK